MTLKRRIVRTITGLAAARGYVLTPAWRVDAQPLAKLLRGVFEQSAIDCVLDVGGNTGQYHDFIRDEVGFAGPIVTFEPIGKYVAILEARALGDPLWTIVPHALGSERTTTQINVTSSPGLNSFLAPRTDQVDGYWDREVATPETVSIERLDDLLPSLRERLKFASPYLKLDTQGFDLEVVRGASGSIGGIRALQTEASVKPIYQGMPTYQQSIDAMTALGFQLCGMFPVGHDERMRLIEFDCVMVR